MGECAEYFSELTWKMCRRRPNLAVHLSCSGVGIGILLYLLKGLRIGGPFFALRHCALDGRYA